MIDFTNKKILIAGAGKSGIAAAKLLSESHAIVIVHDSNSKGLLTEESLKEQIGEGYEGRIILGGDPLDLKETPDYCILSPGVPIDLPFVTAFKESGVKVIGEIELGFYFSKGRIAAVTGTNGKTTTTALTGHILQKAFGNTIVAGNIGIPYTELVKSTNDSSYTVAEVSSFQLDTTDSFRPDVSMILNITPDHLDRHHTMENYINAKLKITKNQYEGDLCILNAEDPILAARAEGLMPHVVWFSSKREIKNGLFVKDGFIVLDDMGTHTKICELDKLKIIGEHNWENAMASIACALFFKVPLDVLREALYSFEPVEHRIEYVRTVNGVKYYNDSKGTNPDASIKAVNAMTTRTYLIGGGYDKNSEYDEWIESFDGKIKCLLLMGQTREKIAACAEKHGFEDYRFVESMEEAVRYCADNAQPGETVLLSPCCASWGMFKNYEERGRIFKDLVRAL
ncbi:MAG: UDP-N-acetylmuramoyl-L-alanine--D-glutamate ligase [Lachnospiraceae bacterium]|nr:UDP-N-acetylmuramoyl-L-alanine--D-glutamate ligase [Lachnospiraceae bacterium]